MEDKRDNPAVKGRLPHLDDELLPERRDVAEGCCWSEGTPRVTKERGKRVRMETGRGMTHGRRRVTG